MDSKIGIAPCGHRGVHVTPKYVTCLEGCDSPRPVPKICEHKHTESVHYDSGYEQRCVDCGCKLLSGYGLPPHLDNDQG